MKLLSLLKGKALVLAPRKRSNRRRIQIDERSLAQSKARHPSQQKKEN
jgi:hypothetical protein